MWLLDIGSRSIKFDWGEYKMPVGTGSGVNRVEEKGLLTGILYSTQFP